MISVCCCAINAKWDVECFVRTLAYHNQDTTFEVCFTHDNRVNDGGSKFYAELSRKYPWFHVTEHTKQDTVDWLEWMLERYRQYDRFSALFRQCLEENLRKFKRDELIDPRKSFLWISSGILYNKAISLAQGDYLVVTPADFLYLFQLGDLERHLQSLNRTGLVYAKPNAIWTRISNSPRDWLEQKLIEDRNKTEHPFGSRMADAQRDYVRYPSGPEDLYLADFRHGQLINLADPAFFSKMETYTRECFAHPDDQGLGPSFHGIHAMSRSAYKAIGGFTEGFYGRAFADDHMSHSGQQLARMNHRSYELPQRFSIGWIGQGEYLPGRFSYYEPGTYEQLLKTKDEYYGQHPIPGASGWEYLHHGYPAEYVNNLSTELRSLLSQPPERFTRDKW